MKEEKKSQSRTWKSASDKEGWGKREGLASGLAIWAICPGIKAPPWPKYCWEGGRMCGFKEEEVGTWTCCRTDILPCKLMEGSDEPPGIPVKEPCKAGDGWIWDWSGGRWDAENWWGAKGFWGVRDNGVSFLGTKPVCILLGARGGSPGWIWRDDGWPCWISCTGSWGWVEGCCKFGFCNCNNQRRSIVCEKFLTAIIHTHTNNNSSSSNNNNIGSEKKYHLWSDHSKHYLWLQTKLQKRKKRKMFSWCCLQVDI